EEEEEEEEEEAKLLKEQRQAGELKEKGESLLTTEHLVKRDTSEEKRAKSREKVRLERGKTEVTPKQEQIKKRQDKLPHSTRIKRKPVAKDKKTAIEEREQEAQEQAVKSPVHPEETEADDKLWNKERQLLKVLASILKEPGLKPMEKRSSLAEESVPIMRVEGHGWEIFQKQDLKTEKGSLEEYCKLLRKNQEKIHLDRAQVEALLTKLRQKQLLKENKLAELGKLIEESEPEKIQLKWLLDKIRSCLLAQMVEEKMEGDLTYPERAEEPEEEEKRESPEENEEEEEEAGPKKKKMKYLTRKVSLREEEKLIQKGKKEERLAEKKKKLGAPEGPAEEEEGLLMKEELGHVGEKDKVREDERGLLGVEEESPREEILREESPREEILREESPREESLREERLREKSLREEHPREKSPSEESLREKSLREERLREERLREKRLRAKSLREERLREK
ncbi:hypothetical protein H671_21526, partial [Cricetulus griseus]